MSGLCCLTLLSWILWLDLSSCQTLGTWLSPSEPEDHQQPFTASAQRLKVTALRTSSLDLLASWYDTSPVDTIRLNAIGSSREDRESLLSRARALKLNDTTKNSGAPWHLQQESLWINVTPSEKKMTTLQREEGWSGGGKKNHFDGLALMGQPCMFLDRNPTLSALVPLRTSLLATAAKFKCSSYRCRPRDMEQKKVIKKGD